MRPRPHLLAFVALLAWGASQPARAQPQPHSIESDALLFLDSQVLPKKAAACSARISGFATRFEPAFRAWLAAYRGRISAGEAFLRADAEKTRMPFERDIQSIAGNISEQWNAAPLSVLRDHCESMLVQLREGPDGE